ncbi:MAG: hypothetical protein K2X69_07100 [Silvanigrellaceae bacterium]|jgi:transposase|nr:hypothetical protein [Silvanigrellaceae bacterium]
MIKTGINQYYLNFNGQVLEVLENMFQIAREFGVSYPTLNSWKTIYF